MEYYYDLQNWLERTNLYQNILQTMPAPLNNINFDTFFLIGGTMYFAYRMIGTVRILIYHKKIRKDRINDIRMQKNHESEVLNRERKLYEKEERFGKFMDCMENAIHSRMKYAYSEPYYKMPGRKRLGFGKVLLEKKEGEAKTERSFYDTVMENRAYEEQLEEDINRARKTDAEEMLSRLHSLEADLIVDCADDTKVISVEEIMDPNIEKRKVRARKMDEKERRKVERRLKKVIRDKKNG